ncbi:MAG: PAS domain S-box protein [Desulfobacteraceae bacterium]|nr:MAG: PAS domain S-box protein [Desulfobacteraceae bacterium]
MGAMTKTNHDRILKSILITGIILSGFYWVCESFMYFFMDPQANFFQHLLGPNMFQTFTRVMVLCLFAIFGSHIQYTLDKERAADAALRASEDKYRTILESIEEGYFETDRSGNLTFFNGSLCRILGYDAEELTGKNTRELTPPEQAAAAGDVFLEVERTGVPAAVVAHQALRKDGSPVDLELSVSLIRGSLGQPVGFRGVVRDVSERLQAEQARRKLESQLQQAQKMEAIGTLAGGIAHDFNNILMGIQGNATLLEMRLEPSHPGHEKIANIEKYVESGTELSRQLLGFARRGKYQVKASDINDIIEKSAAMFARTRKEVRVELHLARNLWTVEVDRGQIEQALLNLYVNAWQAMPEGGDLRLATETLYLDASYVQPYKVTPGRYVRITVADTGIGISKADMARIFEPFFTTKEMGRGTGLGLASVYGIVKSHGGHINVYSEKGQGTTFTLNLPASRQPVEEEAATAPAEIVKGRETILLVDDEEMIIDVGRGMLAELGYTVIAAKSGPEALDLFRLNRERIDLVIMDMIMPGMGGGETFDRLKKIDPKVKVLLSSGYSIDGQASKILERGCDGFIQKPFNLKQLSAKIREVVEG